MLLMFPGEGVLNGGCGSDFVQKDRQLPANFADLPPGARWGGNCTWTDICAASTLQTMTESDQHAYADNADTPGVTIRTAPTGTHRE